MTESTRLSRRRVVQLGAATAGVSLLTATPSPHGGRQASAQEGGEPQRGGTYRLAGGGDVRSLDPGGAEGGEDWWSAGHLLFNRLYAYDKDAQFYPDLAADLPAISADGLVYTIPIRQGVKFHNGRELVADDVAFSLAWQLWPEVYSWGKSYMQNIVGYDEVMAGETKELSGIRVVDPSTVEVTLKVPQAVFPALLSMTMNGISPRQEVIDAGADWGRTVVIGTGPFKLVEWEQGQRVVFERHPEYYKPGLPYLDRVELSLNVDPSVQMLRWENGEIEHAHSIPAGELARMLGDPTFESVLRQGATLETTRLTMYTQAAPFDDLRVRQAVATAIDKVFYSRSTTGEITPLEGIYVPLMPQFEESFGSVYAYDPDGAEALLVEAGHGEGIRGIRIYGLPGSESQLEAIQADLGAIGIEAEVIAGEYQDWAEQINAGDLQMVLYTWGASFPDAYDFVSAWTTCASIESGFNYGAYCNERIDELLAEAEALPQTDPERIAAYREIEDLAINQDAALIGLGNTTHSALGQEYVVGDALNGMMAGWPFLETAWMTPR